MSTTAAVNTLRGNMRERAQCRIATDGCAQLHMDLELPPAPKRKPVHVRAVKHFGSTWADHEVCRQQASLLRRGMRVTLSYATASVRAGRLELTGVDSVMADVPPYIKPYASKA